MKKLLLVFGLPGSGDVELINNIRNNSNNIREKLGISDLNINYLELPYERDTSFSICIGKSIRKDTINSKIRDFSYDYMRNSLLKYTEFAFDYCEIDSINGYNIKNNYIIKNK